MDGHAECSKDATTPRLKSKGGAGVKRTTVQHQQLPPRPKLVPAYPSAAERTPPRNSQAEGSSLPFSLAGLTAAQYGEADDRWVSVITAPAYAPLRCWRSVMQSLIRHPERNSSNILRADILADTSAAESGKEKAADSWMKQWTVRRALLPRRPNLDWRMEQDCSLYYRYRAPGTASNYRDSDDQAHGDDHHEEENVEEALVVYTPLVGLESHPKMAVPPTVQPAAIGAPPPHEAYVPFYHPKVRALAFHFRRIPSFDDSQAVSYGELGISLVPFPSAPDAESDGQFGPTHRLSRVGLSLLTTLHMHTWGELHSYQKRVHHDQIVARTLYQDTYLELKSRYASHLIAAWAEATDPTKHVFEEMGIAAFLIALWRQLYASEQHADENEEWKRGVKFVDVGCGNGLLTYILSREGFKGVGLDLRARKSWTQYRNDGAELHEWTFNPADLIHTPASDVWQGAFLIGNHADELTPWLPVLATHYGCRGFINLPCCYFGLDGTRDFPLLLRGVVPRNEQYLAYVSHVHQQFGWHVELEPLRIPSTKNWCFVGRSRTPLDPDSSDAVVFQERLDVAIQQALASGWAPRSGQT
ncbi:hypothetical protein L1887_58253 [Cichorium endivia]|nr:hypothetical protein L1887_58253 [Cichorium endivia]